MSERVLQACRRWIADASGLPLDRVIPADSPGSKPPLPFAAIKLIVTGAKQAQGETYQEPHGGQGGSVNVVSHFGGTLSVNVYGADAAQYIGDAALYMGLVSEQSIEGGGDVVFYGFGGVNDVSQLLDTSIEPRAQGDFSIRYAVTLAQGVSRDEATRIIAVGTYNDDISDTITIESPED